ncbi:MAG: MBL fold metallo-hydrolase [Treponema sp.]
MKYEIRKFITGPFWVNTWTICREQKNVVIIDPGGTTDELMHYLAEKGTEHITIMLTHGHFDHIAGIPSLIDHYPNYQLLIHSADSEYIGARLKEKHIKSFAPLRAQALIESFHGVIPDATELLSEDKKVGNFSVIHTPGHTNGSISLWDPDEKILFSGDTLFYHAWGRTDLLDGNEMLIHQSLKKLFSTLPDETTVYTGHGTNTSIGAEKYFQLHQ